MKILLIISIALMALKVNGQESNFKTVHQKEAEYYNNQIFDGDYSTINIPADISSPKEKACSLEKIVYGWHPYWMNGLEANYDWSMLSHLCYFGYEVNPADGGTSDSHNWLTTSVVTNAQNAGVKVHLCATMFSDHATFFGSTTAKQNLINNLISYVNSRNADGVNIDFEAVPSTQSANLTAFMIDLCNQMHAAIPGSQITIALPSVNWSGTFDVASMAPYVDIFIIMGYDYYYGGSTTAGPTGGLYNLTSTYTYCQSKSINYYLNAGVPANKLALGVPYYGREYVTAGATPPSSVTGASTTRTYKYIMANSTGYYNQSAKLWENNCFSPYWAYNDGNWNQCFIDDVMSLGKRYDMVNRRGLAGIGIWCLGNDDGYSDLWNLISDKFSSCATTPCTDSIFDMGGPAWNNYDNEIYTYTISPTDATSLTLNFENFELEAGYDSLWLYDGPSIASPLIGGYSGTTSPGLISTTGNSLTVRFYSDNATTRTGFKAVWQCIYDNIVPTTSISASTWVTDDFTATFTDNDNLALEELYYQVLDNNGTEWRANNSRGFFNDNFSSVIHPDWQQVSGTWVINSGRLNQTVEANSNTNIYAPVTQDDSETWLFHWQMNIGGSGTNRRAGLYFFSDDASMDQRNNAYMIYFRVDNNKCQIYRATDNAIVIQTDDDCTVAANTFYDYKVTYNPTSGEIKAYQNNVLVSSWIDPDPLTAGSFISLRTGDCNVLYDDLKVYKSRANTAGISVGEVSSDEVRYQNSAPTSPSCRIKSVVIDESENWSVIAGLDVNVDWTPPVNGGFVNDGISTDLDTTTITNELSANWEAAADVNSGILRYMYAIGDGPGLTNVVGWTDAGTDVSVTHSGLSLTYGTTYYFQVKAQNNASLESAAIQSDGIYIKPPVTLPDAGFSTLSTTYCTGEEIQFINTSSDATSSFWTFEGGTPGTSDISNPVIVYDNPGTYSIKLVVSNSFGSDSVEISNYITIIPSPVASFTVNTTEGDVPLMALFTNNSVNSTSYLWDFGDGAISTDTNPYHYYNEPGVYSVSLTAFGGDCPENVVLYTDYITVNDTITYTENISNGTSVSVYPNPFKDNLNILLDGYEGKKISIVLTDILGKVSEYSVIPENNEFDLPLEINGLGESGIIMLQVYSENEMIISTKLVRIN